MNPGRLELGRWILACAGAEAIGMTASAAAATVTNGQPPATALTAVVAGGLVEGLALGLLQALVLRRWLPQLGRLAWVVVTAVVAGVGWAAASAPSQLGDPSGEAPPLGLIVVGALALGAAMGAVLGAAQALVLRGRVAHPARWIGISAIAWTPAMGVIFLGATLPDESWPRPVVIVLGTVTGAVAGALLGLISGVLSPWLVGSSAVNRITLDLLASPWRGGLARSLVGLRMHGRRTGHLIELPVQYARRADTLVVYPSNATHKNWWRNLLQPTAVEVLLDGRWRTGEAVAVSDGDPRWSDGVAIYSERWARVAIDERSPIVVIDLERERDALNPAGARPPGSERRAHHR